MCIMNGSLDILGAFFFKAHQRLHGTASGGI
jgi:hypothetical protein